MASKQQAYRGNGKPGWPAWAWLGIGVVLGIVLAMLALVRDWVPLLHKSSLPQPNAQAVAPKVSDQAVADAAKSSPPKKTFDFYSVLPEMEVVIPDAELSAKAKAEQARQALAASQAQAQPAGTPAGSSPTAPFEPGSGYMLLAGSYADAHAADESKAKLALLGIVAKVQPVTINGKTWNRILLGPYADASATEAAKKTLADNGIKAIPIKQTAQP
ncbi:MAG: SPOR domain-containing protein [Xanthomonadaceae bacterium]|nr:SPOR domain-containing protein [Xanthomonadaceae bacterium]MDE2083601.1 SPOR domain-containing protein [Xanthomonadaceae bacterium]MDE2256348.1 SPOR domain-containing protein [Xanthomonadaceae bacterium]